MNRIQNKVVLITGATSGIGRACAIAFANKGAKVIIVGRRHEQLLQLQDELVNAAKVYVKQLDVRDKSDVDEFFESLPSEFKSIDILVNNAGLARGLEHVVAGDIDDWEAMLNTNVHGLIYVTKAVLKGMYAQKRGHIINISSISAVHHYANGAVYCASKAAVHAFSRALREECIEKNIRISEIMPGMVNTEFSQVRFHGNIARANSVYDGFEPLIAEDIADLVIYTSNLPAHVNLAETLILPTAQANAHKTYRG